MDVVQLLKAAGPSFTLIGPPQSSQSWTSLQTCPFTLAFNLISPILRLTNQLKYWITLPVYISLKIMNLQQQETYLLDPNLPFNPLKVQFFQQLVCDLNSSDIQKISHANTLLTRLKEDRGISENFNLIIDQCKSHQAILYVLMIFEQQLKTIWSSLNQPQKDVIAEYMNLLLNRITPTDDGISQAVYRKIKLIMVKIFLAEYRESDAFLQKLIEEAKKDQWRCENVLELFSLLGDEIQTGGITFLQSKYVTILTLAAMVLQSSKEAKIKNNLVKNSLIVLQKFISLGKDIVLPREIVSLLLTTLQSNKFRIQICNLLSIICKSSPQTLVMTTEAVCSLLDWTCSIQSFRISTIASELTYTDLLFRALANLVHNLIQAHLQGPKGSLEYLRACFKVNLCLSESEDQDTWVICKQSWILYGRNRLNLLDPDLMRILADILVFRCEQPLLLSNKVHPSQLQDLAEESNTASDFENLLIQVAREHWETMFSKAWGFIECQTFAKFDRKKFLSATFCFCYFQEAIQGKNKIIDVLKLLMNISESVEEQYRRVAVDQFLNVVSFYPEVSTGNQGLAGILEQKFIQNLPHSFHAFLLHQLRISLSTNGVAKLQAKIKEFGCERIDLQTRLWRIILRVQNNTSDTRPLMELDPLQVLQAVVRNLAGLQEFNERWNTRWEVLCHFATQVNEATRAPIVQQMQKNIIQKVSEILVQTCRLFCKLCSDHQSDFRALPNFTQLLHLVQLWPNVNRPKQCFF